MITSAPYHERWYGAFLATSQIDNGFVRFIAEYGGWLAIKGMPEAFENGAQGILDAVFTHIITGEELNIDWGEVAYEALAGFVTSVLLNASEEYANTQSDTTLANAGEVGYTGKEDSNDPETQWQDVVGMTTSDGYTVREIKDHIQEQAVERNIGVWDITDALKQPLHKTDVKYNVNNEPSVQYIGRKATVAYNPETGAVITTWKTGKDKLKKYGGQQ